MSQEKIAKFVTESKTVIAGLQKTASEAQGTLKKIAEAKDAEAARLTKLAGETANYLLQQKVITPGDLQKFAEGLADPAAAHNMIRNLTVKLASAQAPVKIGRVSQQKTAAADEKLDANALWEQRLAAVSGR